MTVMTKTNGLISKEIPIKPLSSQIGFKRGPKCDNIACAEEKIEIQSDWQKRSFAFVLTFWSAVAMLTALLIILGAVAVTYQQVSRLPAHNPSLYGFCSVPIINDISDNYHLPLQFSRDTEMQVIYTGAGLDFPALREHLDLEMSVEKISVDNHGHRISFIHDFSDNTTGIVDDDRCFSMELDPEVVMSPAQFISGLEQGGQFDVSRVRSRMLALPSTEAMFNYAYNLISKCVGKPVYRLQQVKGSTIRKRSAEDPEHDYMYFSGKHVLELKIENLPEILANEKKLKNN